jgi:SAM-dependent methyltransferase
MLTVRYDWLRLQPGDRVLDLGAGFGRHSFEAARRGARVVALDASEHELAQVNATFAAMIDAGQVPADRRQGTVRADATRLPFADNSFDRVIASEVFEHIPDDLRAMRELHRVLRPGGTMAVTVPAFLPELVCWALSEEYHAPFVPGGHVRIYREHELRARLRNAGFRPGAAHHAHALHTPYWWLRCVVGPTNETHPAVGAYRRLLEWDIVSAPPVTRVVEKVLNPVLGKSLVVYAHKPSTGSSHLPGRPA